MESVGAQIFREAGARVATNVLVRDLDLLVPNVHDGRRLEIVAEGLPLFGGVQLVVDARRKFVAGEGKEIMGGGHGCVGHGSCIPLWYLCSVRRIPPWMKGLEVEISQKLDLESGF